MEKNIKERVRENFQTMEFTVAMAINEELKAEYIKEYGKRSWASLVRTYKCRAKINDATENVAKDQEVQEQPIEEDVPVEQSEVVEKPAEVNDGKEAVSETFTFDTSSNAGRFNNESIQSLIDSKDPILNQFCIVREYFKQESDTETVRNTRMFVKENGEGWPLYDEASAIAKSKELKSGRKLGFFTNSNDGFPVGEEYCQITVMRIKVALERFVIGREGITRVNVAESIEKV